VNSKELPESAERTIARKTYYSMGEVCKLCHLESHVLRYWETQFSSLKPKKNRAGNRVFKHKDIDLIFLIKHLLYEKKFTIEGACQQIKRLSDTADQKNGETGDPDDRYFLELKKDLIELRGVLDRSKQDGGS
jgi:DNA-binding transcriptional MerR regulator